MRRISLLLLSLFPFIANAQFSESIVSDRPGQSLSPNTVGKKVLQIQAGYVHDNSEYTGLSLVGREESLARSSNDHYGNVKIRYGIFEKTEISFQTSLGREKIERSGGYGTDYEENIADFGLGVRQNFLNEGDHALALGAEAEYYYSYDDVSIGKLTVSASKSFFEKLSVTANVGYLYETDFFWTANVAYQLSDKMGAFVEYYPQYGEKFLSTDDCIKMRNASLNTGLVYQLSPNFLVDVAGFFQTYDSKEIGDVQSSGFSFQVGFTSKFDWRE